MTVDTGVIAETKQVKPRTQGITWGKVGRIIPPAFGAIWLVIAFYPILFIVMTSLRSQGAFTRKVPGCRLLTPHSVTTPMC